MEENKTTTTNDTTVAGAQDALPETGNQEVAVITPTTEAPTEPTVSSTGGTTGTEEPTQTQDAGGARPLPDEEKLKSFAKGQGIEDLSELSQREMSLLKSAYDNKAEYERNRQRSSELEKAANITNDQLPADASPQQVEGVRLRNLELKLDIQSWKMGNQDKLAYENEMVQVLSDPNKKALVQEGYLTLDDVYKLAKASTPDNSATAKSQGKREALESLAHKQQAAVPTGSATNTGFAPKAKKFEDLSIAEMETKLGFARR